MKGKGCAASTFKLKDWWGESVPKRGRGREKGKVEGEIWLARKRKHSSPPAACHWLGKKKNSGVQREAREKRKFVSTVEQENAGRSCITEESKVGRIIYGGGKFNQQNREGVWLELGRRGKETSWRVKVRCRKREEGGKKNGEGTGPEGRPDTVVD